MSMTSATADSLAPEITPAAGEDDTKQRFAWLLARTQASAVKPHHYLLVLRFALVNLLGFAVLAAAAVHGLIERVLSADRTFLSLGIFLVFLGGLAICAWKVWQASRELNQVKDFDPLTTSGVADYLARVRGRSGDSRAILASTLRLRLSQRIAVVRQVAGSLVLLGLIGTVLGFIIALSGVDPARASDVQAIGPMVSTLIQGMSTALYTTLVGSVLNVWLMINYRLLAGGTVKLITALVELGEAHGQS